MNQLAKQFKFVWGNLPILIGANERDSIGFCIIGEKNVMELNDYLYIRKAQISPPNREISTQEKKIGQTKCFELILTDFLKNPSSHSKMEVAIHIYFFDLKNYKVSLVANI